VKTAGLVYGNATHHLDHLAPFSSLMGIPLLVTDEGVERLARDYYPALTVHYLTELELPDTVVASYDLLYTALARPMMEEILFFAQTLRRKKLRTAWLPHGNSDKGHVTPWMEALKGEEIVLAYGPKMVNFLKEKEIFSSIGQVLEIGNFRLTYYKRHREFYAKLLPLPTDKPVILYAPTWQDSEGNSSMPDALAILIETLPLDIHLVIKPHPNLPVPQLSHPNVILLTNFPPIYPLLEVASGYIGDMSSIGYDFLEFNRPMVFLNPHRRTPHLYRCGIALEPEAYGSIYDCLRQPQDHLREVRSATAAMTFGQQRPWNTVKQQIKAAISHA
jgi:hypothetical protein